jgi:predicted HAD superfamily Cof-like phosphohydrolase
VYATYGTAAAVASTAVLAEIHKANMTALDADCRPIERHGKVQ